MPHTASVQSTAKGTLWPKYFLILYVVGVGADLVPDLIFGNKLFIHPTGLALDLYSDAIYVTDTENNRVFRSDNRYALTNNSMSDLIFGQADIGSVSPDQGLGGGNCSAQTLWYPVGAAVDESGSLWVVDYNSNRALQFQNAATITTNDPSAQLALGQPNLDSNFPNTTASSLSLPYQVRSYGGNLWVADLQNKR